MDKVRPLKIENLTDGSQDDDGYQTELDPAEDYVACKGIAFENSEGHTIDRNPSGELRFNDPINGVNLLSDLLTNSSGITENDHKLLDTLIHNIAETSYYETTYDGTYLWRINSEIWWTDSSKTIKIREILYSYTSIWKYATIIYKQYKAGVLNETYTGSITYNGVFIETIDWLLT